MIQISDEKALSLGLTKKTIEPFAGLDNMIEVKQRPCRALEKVSGLLLYFGQGSFEQ